MSSSFVGVDGETIKDSYALFGAGEAALWDRRGIDLVRALDWLASEFPIGSRFVAFSFHYDIGMMVKGYTDQDILKMMKSGSVKLGRWRVRYFPKRILRATTRGASVTVYDVWSFFGCGFEEAMKRTGLHVPEVVRWGKRERVRFDWRDRRRIEFYNRAECLGLQAMCDKLEQGMLSQRIAIKSWHGPGALADSVLKTAGVREEIRRPNLGLKDLFSRAYFGGRIETLKIGSMQGVDVYDINSAYPEATTWLWDQTRGKWKYATAWTAKEFPVSLWHLEWVLPDSTYVGPLPFRRPDGRIYFPRRGRGWYWWPEASIAARLHPEVQVLEGYVWNGPSSTRLNRVVRDLYRRRLILKEEGRSVEAHVLKLAMNSLYGKMAQTVGKAPWQAPAWAGYVTSYTRAKLREAVIGYEQDIVAFATDGVFLRGGNILPVALGDKLGHWKRETGYSGLVLGAGMYNLSNERETRTGTRGGSLPWTKILRQLNRKGYAEVHDTVFVSPLISILMPYAFGPHRARWIKRKRVIAPWANEKVKRYYQYLSIKRWDREWCDSSILDGWLEESAPFDSEWLGGISVAHQDELLETLDTV